MQIFITGIAGFIGFHLALFLKKRGDTVSGCDNFNSYYDPSLKRARAEELKKHHIPVFEGDIRDSAFLKEKITQQQATHVVHLAAQAGVRHSLTHPETYVETNLEGFVTLLEVLKQFPALKLVFASSSSVYGNNTKIPFAESDCTDQPCSLYGATKKSNEVLAYAYHHMFGLSCTALRFFTVYGPWGRPDMAYFSFTQAILEGKPLKIYNQGQMQRDFTYIDDIVHGCAQALDKGCAYDIFNLGNNHPEEILTLVRYIEELTGKKAQVELLPHQPGEVKITYADLTKSQQELGYQPRVSLKEGMERFWKWYVKFFNL